MQRSCVISALPFGDTSVVPVSQAFYPQDGHDWEQLGGTNHGCASRSALVAPRLSRSLPRALALGASVARPYSGLKEGVAGLLSAP